MKKIISMILISSMVLSFSAISVFADEEDVTVTSSTTEAVQTTATDSDVDNEDESVKPEQPKVKQDKLIDVLKKAVLKDVPQSTIEQLEASHFNYIRIALISGLSEKSGKSIDDVVAAFKESTDIDLVCEKIGIEMKDYIEVHKAIMEKIKVTRKEVKENNKLANQDKLLQFVSEYTKLTKDVVEKMLDDGLNFDQIALIAKLDEKSDKTVEEVTTIVKESKNVKEIANKLEIKPSVVAKEKAKFNLHKVRLQNMKEKSKEDIEDVKVHQGKGKNKSVKPTEEVTE